jgi:hypothetical protein
MLGQDLNSTMNKGEAPPALEQKISLPCVTFMRKGETVDLDYSGVKTDGAVSWEVSPNLNITCRGSGILTMDASKLPFGMAIVTAKYGDQTARSLVIALPW